MAALTSTRTVASSAPSRAIGLRDRR
jgi:hypothetical protein